ncbi:MAG: hypothetical protein IJP96_07000 [Synergistaceae bacterium]|nr:hypothetical protein [Synergistaceae bacterium]
MTTLERKLMNMQPNARKKAVEAISDMMGMMSSPSKTSNRGERKGSVKKK